MRFIKYIVVIFLIPACQNDEFLKDFYITKSKEVNYQLGFYDLIKIEKIKKNKYTDIQVEFNASSVMLGNQWEGKYLIHNDTLELFADYNKDKDKYPNMDFSDAHTITYHYCFKNLDISKYKVFFTQLNNDYDNKVE